MPERPVTPSDCALAVALPLSAEELRSELESERPSDFVAGIRRRFPRTPPARLCADYGAEMETGRRAMESVRAAGVTVVLAARLPDLARLTEHYHVVSVIAHTPSAGFAPDDVLDPALFAEIARTGMHADQKRVRRHLRLRGVALGPGEVPEAGAIASVLEGLSWPPGPRTHASPRLSRNGSAQGPRRGQMDRTRIEDAFPRAVREAPVIELADGLHPLSAVRGAVSSRFEGVLDLSTCTSVVLAEALKRSRNDFLVLGTVRPTYPRMRFLLHDLRIRELALASGPVRFTRVVRVVADALAVAARS